MPSKPTYFDTANDAQTQRPHHLPSSPKINHSLLTQSHRLIRNTIPDKNKPSFVSGDASLVQYKRWRLLPMTRPLRRLSAAPHIPKSPSPTKLFLHQFTFNSIFFIIDPFIISWGGPQVRYNRRQFYHLIVSRRGISTNFEIWECWATHVLVYRYVFCTYYFNVDAIPKY